MEVSWNGGSRLAQNGGFIMGNPTKMNDLGVPLFQETSIYQIAWSLLSTHVCQTSMFVGK